MSVRSLLLGLDVSPRRLGFGLVDLVTGEPVACGCEAIDLPDHGWQHTQIARALADLPVYVDYPSGPYDVPEIQAVYIEDTAKAGKFRQHDAGRAQGIAQAEVERRWPHAAVQFLAPAEWRKLAGLPGNASKADVWLAAQSVMNDVVFSQDAADALLVAVAGQRRNGETWDRAVATGAA